MFARLADVTEVVPNIKPEEHPEKEFGYIDISSIDNSSFKVRDVKKFIGSGAPSRARRPIQPGDVLFSNVRTYLRNIALVLPETTAEVCSTGFTVLRPSPAVDPAYLFRYVLTDAFVDQVTPQQTGTHYPATSDKVVMAEKIPLPPLNEQRRIVAKLEELLAKVDASQQRLAKIPVILKRFRQAVLAAACSGRLTADWREENLPSPGASRHPLPKGEGKVVLPLPPGEGRGEGEELPERPESWRWVKLPETGEMNRGKSRHRPRNHPSLFGGPYPFIQTGDIAQSGGKITSHKQNYSETGLAQSRLWQAGTICITIAANIAESAMLTYPACFPDSVVGVIADPKVSVAEYVEYFIRVAKADLATFAPATAQKNINIAILNEVSVPLPPLPEQHEIVRRVEALFTLADQLEARYHKAKAHVDRLTQSILAKAFRGELVPQDSADEPASVLLERIRAEKSPSPLPLSRRERGKSTNPRPLGEGGAKRRVREVLLAAEPTVPYGATIPQRILSAMQPGRDYSRADVTAASGITDAEWIWAIRQLKEEGKVRQTGERRGARYRRTSSKC